MAVIDTWFHSTGGLPHQSADWFAMTALFRQTPIQVIGFNKQIVKLEFVGFVPPIVGRGYDPAAHVPMREMYVLPCNTIAQFRQVGGGVITPPYRASAINAEFTSVLTKADNLNCCLSLRSS